MEHSEKMWYFLGRDKKKRKIKRERAFQAEAIAEAWECVNADFNCWSQSELKPRRLGESSCEDVRFIIFMKNQLSSANGSG